MELSDRKKNILKSVIDAYISSGEPVGSKYLALHDKLSVSSATIRNEMNELEVMGFLEQPHTSSGRVPTAQGYRTYIEDLMERYMLSMEELEVLNGLLSFKVNEISKVFEEASRVISTLTNYPTFAVLKPQGNTAGRFEAIYIDEHNFLLVIICKEGTVKSRQITINEEFGEPELKVLIEEMNRHLIGVAPEQIALPIMLTLEERMGEKRTVVSFVLRIVYEMLTSGEQEKVSFNGVTKLLNYPEFLDVSKARQLLEMFEQRRGFINMLIDSLPGQLNVLIDGEGRSLSPPDTSFVFHPISVSGRTIGAIGVIGPKRMDYKKVIASIEYFVSGLTDELNKE